MLHKDERTSLSRAFQTLEEVNSRLQDAEVHDKINELKALLVPSELREGRYYSDVESPMYSEKDGVGVNEFWRPIQARQRNRLIQIDMISHPYHWVVIDNVRQYIPNMDRLMVTYTTIRSLAGRVLTVTDQRQYSEHLPIFKRIYEKATDYEQ